MSMQIRLIRLAPVICLLASQQCGELAAFAIVPPLGVHQTMTEEALTESNFQFKLPNGEQIGFNPEAIDPIKLENKAIDDMSEYIPKYHAEWHFDQERFSEGQGHLLRTRDLIILYLKDEAFRKSDPESLVKQEFLTKRSRSLLGNALHPLQDFYSHTNWVERHLARGFSEENIPINFALGAKGESLPGGTDEACDVGTRGTIPLTSGDYFAAGVKDCSKLCTARINKCAHGNVWPTYGLAEAFCEGGEIPPNFLHCGMNKDHSFRAYHEPAYKVAKKHTAIFVTEIFNEALSTSGANESFVALAICRFMGVPDPVSTCTTSHTVTVQKLNKANGQPTLGGLVQSSGENITPAIDCGFLCEGTAIAGSTVVVTAKDSGNWKFVRWDAGGACASSVHPKCSFVVNGPMIARPVYTLVDVIIPLSPQATFLRVAQGDSAASPVVIDLNNYSIVPGQEVELASFGFWSYASGRADDARSAIMVFSSSNQLLPSIELQRVPGALSTSQPGIVSHPTCLGELQPTDIPEDFNVSDPVVVTVPIGAQFLFVGNNDCYYSDNTDNDGDYVISITTLE